MKTTTTKRILHYHPQQNILCYHHHHHITKKRRLTVLESSTGEEDKHLHLYLHQQQDSPVTVAVSPIISGDGEEGGEDYFDLLPDDLVICILTKLSSTANSPPDFINVFSTCKRLRELAHQKLVLSKANRRTFSCSAKKWSDSDSAHRFLKLCADSGNIEACYQLGMISFYCLQNRASGASLIAKAAIHSHAQALYSLAVIQFNGSGGTKTDKDLRAGVSLCARAAFFGHIDALRELGHCLQDGYGITQNVAEGRRFLYQATARELAAVLSSCVARHRHRHRLVVCSGLGSGDCGCNVVPVREVHQVNRFLSEWFEMTKNDEPGLGSGSGLRMCSHVGCGRPETRRHEFRRCSVCNAVNYCSRACQALDWKLRHKSQCTPTPAPVEPWLDEDVDVYDGEVDVGADVGVANEEDYNL